MKLAARDDRGLLDKLNDRPLSDCGEIGKLLRDLMDYCVFRATEESPETRKKIERAKEIHKQAEEVKELLLADAVNHRSPSGRIRTTLHIHEECIDLLIIGAGGHGQVVLDGVKPDGQVNVFGFIDSDPKLWGKRIKGVSVLGGLDRIPSLRDRGVSIGIVAIGDNADRLAMCKRVANMGLKLATLTHTSAVVARTATVGFGCFLAMGSHLGAGADVDHFAILNTGCMVDHECKIGLAAHICPGAVLAGRVEVGRRAFVGLGARVIQGVTIGPDAIVGAGAVVLEDVPAGATVVGIPAKIIKHKA